MSKAINFKDSKTLKPIIVVMLLYSVLMVIKYLGHLTGLFFEPKNPLVPKFMAYYVAFPSYFVLPFFALIIFLCVRSLKSKNYNFKVVYVLFGIVFLFFVFQWRIYQFIMSFNPYGS